MERSSVSISRSRLRRLEMMMMEVGSCTLDAGEIPAASLLPGSLLRHATVCLSVPSTWGCLITHQRRPRIISFLTKKHHHAKPKPFLLSHSNH